MAQIKHKNADTQTVDAFSDQWIRFEKRHESDEENKFLFDRFFSIFPWEIINNQSKGFEIGCGRGRYAKFIAPKVGALTCVDVSASAIEIAKKNLATFSNCDFKNESVGNLSLKPQTYDFGYAYGVLMHVPDTAAAFAACAAPLKSGAPFLAYIYYNFDNRPPWFQAIWKASDVTRKTIYKLPSGPRFIITEILAAIIYWPLAKISWLGEKLGINVHHWPLSDFRHATFNRMRNNSRDRFGTPLEQRFSKAQIKTMMENAGFTDIEFREGAPYWCALGYKS